MAMLPMKDLPPVPRSKIVTDTVGASSITLLTLGGAGESDYPLAMEYTGKDVGSGEVKLLVRALRAASTTVKLASITVDKYGRVTDVKEAKVAWEDISGRPDLGVTDAQLEAAINNYFQRYPIRVDWSQITNKPSFLTAQDVINIIRQYLIDNPQGGGGLTSDQVAQMISDALAVFKPTWSSISNKPSFFPVDWTSTTNINAVSELVRQYLVANPPGGGGGLTTDQVNGLISSSFTGRRASEEHFFADGPFSADDLLHARIFATPVRLSFGEGKRFAKLVNPPTTGTLAVALLRDTVEIARVTFDTAGVATWPTTTHDFGAGSLLTVKTVGAANGAGNLAMTFVLGEQNGALPPEPPKGDFPANQQPIATTSPVGKYVVVFAPTEQMTVNLDATSVAKFISAPTAAASFTFEKNGTQVGTIAFAASATEGTFTGGAVSLARGDILAIKCIADGGGLGFTYNLSHTTASGTKDKLTVCASLCDTAIAGEVLRHVFTEGLTLSASKSLFVAAQHDADTATSYEVRLNGVTKGTVNFAAGSNTGTSTLANIAVVKGDILTVGCLNASSLAGTALCFTSVETGEVLQASAAAIYDAPARQLIGAYVAGAGAASTVKLASAVAKLGAPAAAAFTLVIRNETTKAEIGTISFAAGDVNGVFSTTADVSLPAKNLLAVYVKTGTATRPAVTFPLA